MRFSVSLIGVRMNCWYLWVEVHVHDVVGANFQTVHPLDLASKATMHQACVEVYEEVYEVVGEIVDDGTVGPSQQFASPLNAVTMIATTIGGRRFETNTMGPSPWLSAVKTCTNLMFVDFESFVYNNLY